MTTHLPIKLSTTLVQRPFIGTPLAELLRVNALEQQELAAHLGVTPNTITRWVHNKSRPYPRHIRAIAEAFEVEPQSLIDHAAEAQQS